MASITVLAARAEDALGVVAGGGYLSFSEIDGLESTSLYLCRESRRQAARKVRVTKKTPRTLWCRARNTSDMSSGRASDGGGCSGSASGGGGCSGGANFRHGDRNDNGGSYIDMPSTSTSVPTGSTSAAWVGPTGVFAKGAKILGAGVIRSLPKGSPDASAPSPSGTCSGAARWFMYPLVEVLRLTEANCTSNTTSSGNPVTCGAIDGGNGEAHRVQTRGAELEAKTLEGQKTAGQPSTSVGVSHAHNAVDKGVVCSPGENGRANAVLTRPIAVPAAAKDSASMNDSRVPVARVTIIRWVLPATELTAPGFSLPESAKEIHLGEVESVFSSLKSPDTFQVLSFAHWSNRRLEAGCLPWPAGLKRIHFGTEWNIDLHGARESWPDSVDILHFPLTFNQPLTGDGIGLPPCLREIKLGKRFNQSLIGVEWPPELQKLTFSPSFDQPLEGVRFPAGLREIYLWGRFNHEVAGVIWPKDLEILHFGATFNRIFASPGAEEDVPHGRKHTLPAGLKHLHLEDSFNHPLSGYELPDGLAVLGLGASFEFMSSVRWPSGLNRLYLSDEHSGSRLVFGSFARSTLPIALPPNLKILEFGDLFNLPLTRVELPQTLKVLDLGGTFDHPIGRADGDTPLLPDGLEELRLGRNFNRSIENIRLPVGLKRLIIASARFGIGCGSSFNQGLSRVMWPPGVEKLELGDRFNQPMEGTTFPKTLRELSFGEGFRYSIQCVVLPDGLTRLSFGWYYPVPRLLELDWPRSLQSMHLGGFQFNSREHLVKWVSQRR